MKSACVAFLSICTLVGWSSLPCCAQTSAPATIASATTQPAPTVSDAEILRAIRHGADFLLRQKSQDNWERNPQWQENKLSQNGGETAMALWALLSIGQSVDDPQLEPGSEELAPAVQWLLEHPPETVYVAGVEARVLQLLSATPASRKPLEQIKARLLASQLNDGGFSYALSSLENGTNPATATAKPEAAARPEAPSDTSNSSYGLAGVLAAVEGGDRNEPRLAQFWTASEKFWRARQNADGGWGYTAAEKQSRPVLSANGAASLCLLDRLVSKALMPDTALSGSLAFVLRGFQPEQSPENNEYLFAVARLGEATGLRQMGAADWYDRGARILLDRQQPDGSWSGRSPAVSTAYALLFLTQGRSPLAFSKLYEGPPVDAALQSTDGANLAHWLGRTFEEPLRWRLVSMQDGVASFSTAPILLIPFSATLPASKFSADELAKLRQFCDGGGTIFSSGKGLGVLDAVRKDAAQLADGKYTLHKLPSDHPLFEVNGKMSNPPELYGLSNGVRELWVHSPIDMNNNWAKGGGGAGDAWRVPAMLLRYVSGGTGSLHIRAAVPNAPPTTEAATITVGVARIQYDGNWNPEPAAWPRMASTAETRFRTIFLVTSVEPEKLDVQQTPVAHLTGTGKISLTHAQRVALKKYIDEGGLLFVDAAGAKPEFIASARKLFEQMYPDSKLEPIPLNSPIYNGSIPHTGKVDVVSYRRFGRHKEGDDHSPRLEAIMLYGRDAIVFSREDITSGLLETDTWGIAGYTPRSAQALARNVILYANAMKPRPE
jgi:hypothetical protein